MEDNRLVFDKITSIFDKWRCRYSQELFDYIVKECGLEKNKKCLEIGPGTGQATDFALQTGCEYTAIELGENLAAFMKNKYADKYPNFHLINADFETYDFEEDSYDLIYSAAVIQQVYDKYFKPENPYKCKFNYENGTAYGLQYLGKKEFYGKREFSADEYIEYIHTHSDHTAIAEDCRESFFEGIRGAILQHGDRIVFYGTYVLYLYRKEIS